MEIKEQSIFTFKTNLTLKPSEVDGNFKKHHSFYVLLLHFASTYVLSTIIALIIESICNHFSIDEKITTSISQTVSNLITLALLIPLMYKTIAHDAKIFSKKFWLSLLFAIGCYIIFYLVINLFYTFVIEKNFIKLMLDKNIISKERFSIISKSINQQETEKLLSNNIALLISIPSIIIFAPFIEELIFRKALFRFFDFKKPCLNALVSGLIFALVHVILPILVIILSILANDSQYVIDNIYLELIFFVNYFLCGFLLGFIYNISGQNFFVSFIVHLLNNLIVLIQVITK